MTRRVLYKGRPAVREAMRILNHSTRFIIIADDENGHDLPLYCSGYPAESAVADQLMKVGVAMLRKHRQEVEEARLAAGLPASGSPAPAPAPAPVPAPGEGRVVNPLAELVLPAGVGAPPAFGGQEAEDG